MNYQRIYDQIINRAKAGGREKNTGVYYEGHHVVPKCVGGEGTAQQWRTHSNIVLLTAKEHYVCHLLLCRIYSGTEYENKMNYAIYMMSRVQNNHQPRYKPSARAVESIKTLGAETIRKTLQGRVPTEEHRRKNSEAKKGVNNPRYGKRPVNAKKLVDPITGTKFNTCIEAAKYFKVSQGSISHYISKGTLVVEK